MTTTVQFNYYRRRTTTDAAPRLREADPARTGATDLTAGTTRSEAL
jgi:hypothetical protein